MIKLFFSYSHRDESLRDELEIHLSALKRQGIIENWHDRGIGAGKEFANEISNYLEEAQIILLLISPYFIASDYCYDIEMKRAMEKHEAGEARVIPVILHPSDWQSLPFGKLLAVPTDGKPISRFPNQHDAFLEITQAIREAVKEFGNDSETPNEANISKADKPKSQIVPQFRSSNLRIKKTFSDLEKDKFENDAFEFIANFFEGSLQELKNRNSQIDFNFRRIDANHFAATIFLNGSQVNTCSIRLGNDRFFPGITFSQGRSINSDINDSLSITDDGYNLFLKPMNMFNYSDEDKNLSFEGAAEHFWEKFISPLQQ